MEKQVCRDFLRNVCHRDRCKYKHPSMEELEQTVNIEDTVYEFCHDFQNDQCQRQNCRFIHCSLKEEEEYNATKKLPLRLKYQYDYGISDFFLGQDKKMNLEQSIRILEEAGKPVCRNYLNFECNRGQNCKYIHIDIKKAAELAAEMDMGACVKRPRMVLEENNGYQNNIDQAGYNINIGMQNRLSQPLPEHLEEENVTLRKRIQELEKQVSDLAATNEVLLEQNAQFRLHKRGITNYGHSKAMTSSYSPTGMTTHANLQGNPVVNNNQQPVPVQLNVQVTGQPQVAEVRNSLVQPSQRTMVAPEQRMLQQVPASVSRTTEIAQVLAANIAANSGGTVETIPVQNQIVSALSGPIQQTNAMIQQPSINQMNQQPIASYSASIPSHNQLVHQSMAPYSGAMPTHNQMGQQPVSFANTIMAAALANGRNVIQNGANIAVTIAGDVRQPPVGSMGQQVAIHQPALVYTVTRSTDNMQLASTIVPATGHELALVADAQQRNTAPLHGGQGYRNVSSATQAIVQSRQPSDLVQAAPLTSGIGAAITSMPPAVSRGGVHPGVQQNNLVQAPRVNNVSCSVVNGGGQLNEQTLITFPISAVPQQQMHN